MTSARPTEPASPPGSPTDLAEQFAAEPELVRACLQGVEQESPVAARLIYEAAQAALRRCPNYADLLYHAAQAAGTGEWSAAADLLDRALRINPRYTDALVLAAKVALHTEQWDRAGAFLDTALAGGADYPDVHLLRGDVWRRTGDFARARAAYERAVRLNSNMLTARVALAALPPGDRGESHELPA